MLDRTLLDTREGFRKCVNHDFSLFFVVILYFFLAALSLHWCMRAFSSCSEWRLLSSCGTWILVTCPFCSRPLTTHTTPKQSLLRDQVPVQQQTDPMLDYGESYLQGNPSFILLAGGRKHPVV